MKIIGEAYLGNVPKGIQKLASVLDSIGYFGSASWDTYKQTDGSFWHPSKSTEDNLRGYAEAGGEAVGGTLGGVGGFFGGGAIGGPAAPVTAVGGAAAGGYGGGKFGKADLQHNPLKELYPHQQTMHNYLDQASQGLPNPPTK